MVYDCLKNGECFMVHYCLRMAICFDVCSGFVWFIIALCPLNFHNHHVLNDRKDEECGSNCSTRYMCIVFSSLFHWDGQQLQVAAAIVYDTSQGLGLVYLLMHLRKSVKC